MKHFLNKLFKGERAPKKVVTWRPILEVLEDRVVPTTTLFLDFGDAFPTAGLSMTVQQLRTTLAGPNLTEAASGSLRNSDRLTFQPFASQVNFDYNGDGANDARDAATLRATILTLVQRYYAPFDIDIRVAAARNLTDVANSLTANRGDRTGQFDAYAFIAGVTSSGRPIVPTLFGQAPEADIGHRNARDDSVVVFANNLFNGGFRGPAADTALALTIAHEAGHAFGLEHTTNNDLMPAVSDAERLTSSDIIGQYVGAQDFEFDFFTRFNLSRVGGGTQNSYDKLARDADIGARHGYFAYVTGTGTSDRITISRLGDTSAQVTVDAFRRDGFGAADLISTYSYRIDTSNGILVEAGAGNDRIAIDAALGVQVMVHGMAGTDELFIMGGGLDFGSYTPESSSRTGLDGRTSLGGRITAGRTTIIFDEFETTGSVTVSGLSQFNLITPNGADDLLVDSTDIGQNRVSGTSGGVSLVPLNFFSIGSVTIEAGRNDGAAADDVVTIDPIGLRASGLHDFVIQTGAGADTLNLRSGRFRLPATGGIFSFNGGPDADLVRVNDDLDFELQSSQLVADGNLNLAGVETAEITGGPGSNRLGVNGWLGRVTLNGGEGADVYEVTFTDFGSESVDIADSGAAGSDALTVNGTTGSDNIQVAVGQVSRDTQIVTYAQIESLVVDAGRGIDHVEIQSVARDLPITVSGGGDDDRIFVYATDAEGRHTVSRIASLLTIQGGGGRDTLTLDDTGSTVAKTVTVTPTDVGAGPTDNFFPVLPGGGGYVVYSDISQLNLQMSDGPSDIIHVTPSAQTRIFVHGHDPVPFPVPPTGDALTLHLTGDETNPAHHVDLARPGWGMWTFSNRQDVEYESIEQPSSPPGVFERNGSEPVAPRPDAVPPLPTDPRIKLPYDPEPIPFLPEPYGKFPIPPWPEAPTSLPGLTGDKASIT